MILNQNVGADALISPWARSGNESYNNYGSPNERTGETPVLLERVDASHNSRTGVSPVK